MDFKKIKLDQILGSDNLANAMPDAQLTHILNEVRAGYDYDVNSRVEWLKRQEDSMRLALQVVEEKNSPWPGAANVKYPLLTTATMQFGARAYPGLIPGSEIVRGKVNGFDSTGQKAKSAQRVGKHMSYQMLEEMDGWEDGMDRLCVSIPIVGSMFKKTYWSPSKEKNVSELIYPKNLVVNYWTVELASSPRITHIIDLDDNEIHERKKTGVFRDIDYVKEKVPETDESKEDQGLYSPDDETYPHQFKEQHTWLDLDGDGYKEPYIVTFGDGEIARIVACFTEEGLNLNDKGEVIRINRIEYFTKYGFVPSPDGGFYDIGFGILLGPINKSINTTLNQLHDAGTMATRAGGFLGRGAKIKGGKNAFKPFEWINLQSTGDDIRKNIYPLPVREPSPTLFSLLGLLIEAGKELSSTVPMMMGQNPGQNQAATTSMAVVEQGLKVYSSIFKRLHRSLKSEVKKLKALNAVYLQPEGYFQVLDPKEEPMLDPNGQPVMDEQGQPMKEINVAERIFQEDYSDDNTDVTLYSDPNIISDTQRMIKAQQIAELMQQGSIPNRDAGTRIILEAMDLPNVDELLTAQEPPPDPEMELKKAELEFKERFEAEKLLVAKERLELDRMIAEDKAELNDTVAMLNIAKTESEEAGIQIKAYETELKELKIHAESEKREAKEDERTTRMVEGLTKKKTVSVNRNDNGDITGADVD
jgi:chaperonin GroES